MNINGVLWVTALFMSKGFTAKCDMRTSHIIFVYTNEDFGVWLHKRSRMVVMVELKLPLLGSEKILFHDLNLWFMKFRLLINYNFNDLYHHISKWHMIRCILSTSQNYSKIIKYSSQLHFPTTSSYETTNLTQGHIKLIICSNIISRNA